MSRKLWDRLNMDERKNIICRYLEAEPGKHCSCLARDFDVPNARISYVVQRTRGITKQPQKMRLRGHSSVRVNRLYLATPPKIDYDQDRFDPQGTACSTMWYLLSSEEKCSVILRELDGKANGLSMEALAKRIGLELSAAKRWIKRMDEADQIAVEGERVHSKAKPKGMTLNKAIFEYTENGWQKVAA